MMYGGIEAGGTKMNCAVADQEGKIIASQRIATREPAETLAEISRFFDRYELAAMGIGSFGPIGLDPKQANYGHVLATPKAGWQNFDFLGTLKQRYPIPMVWTTDVNAAAYGELKKGAAQDCDTCIYLTVGTGIGAGVIVNSQLFQGKSHPEMGHIRIKRHPEDSYVGTCPYHQDCFEGLAAGPSIEARTGQKGETLLENHPVWELQAYYIAQALVNYTLSFVPDKIILGGGVMNQTHLLSKIREQFLLELGGYISIPSVEEYIVPWQLVNESGIKGCLQLAIDWQNESIN